MITEKNKNLGMAEVSQNSLGTTKGSAFALPYPNKLRLDGQKEESHGQI